MLKKPLLPEWRYWPAIPLAALILAASGGFALTPLPKEIAANTSKANQTQGKADDPEERLAEYTLGLTILTGGIVITGFLQILVLIKADRTARTGLEIAGQQNALMVAQSNILERQVTLGQAQFIAAHRPQLTVRHIAVHCNNTKDAPSLWGYDDTVNGSLVVVNIGGSKAQIIASIFRIYFCGDVLPLKNALMEKNRQLMILPVTLKAGDSIALSISSPVDTDINRGGNTFLILKDRDATGLNIYVMGQIRYRDEVGNDRFMGFCRRWNGNGTFTAVPNQDYEYED